MSWTHSSRSVLKVQHAPPSPPCPACARPRARACARTPDDAAPLVMTPPAHAVPVAQQPVESMSQQPIFKVPCHTAQLKTCSLKSDNEGVVIPEIHEGDAIGYIRDL